MACGSDKYKITKEHFWPRWLATRTGTHKTGVPWLGEKRITAYSAKLPLCSRCNRDFGTHLEGPVSQIFDDLETGNGISDTEAEILVRWLWKFEGLAWRFMDPEGTYSQKYTIRERVLNPIDEIREQLVLAIALIEEIDPNFRDAPMGIDSMNRVNAIFVSGVFSRIAILVVHSMAETEIPGSFSLYHLLPSRGAESNTKLFFPKTGFEKCTDAVATMTLISPHLSYLHDQALGDQAEC